VRVGMCLRLRGCHESRQVPNPYAKLASINTPRVIGRVVKDAEHVLDKKVRHRESHARESPHEEAHRVRKILIKRGATTVGRVYPGVVVIEPTRM